MCVVSVVVGGLTQPGPNFLNWTTNVPSPDIAKQLLEVIERLEKLDKRLGNVECAVEEKKKRAFKRRLKKRAERSERKT